MCDISTFFLRGGFAGLLLLVFCEVIEPSSVSTLRRLLVTFGSLVVVSVTAVEEGVGSVVVDEDVSLCESVIVVVVEREEEEEEEEESPIFTSLGSSAMSNQQR